MPKCEQCGKEVDIPFECKFCGGYYCIEHRLPENHNCPNLPPRTPLGSWQTKKEIAIAHTEEKTGDFASEGELHFIREATPKQEVPKKTRRYVKGVVISVLAIACLVLLFVYAVPYLTNLGSPKRFSFNEEIRNFPITKTAVTFTGWKFTKELVYGEADEGNVFVVINYTVRNIGDTKMGFYDLYEFEIAQAPILQYGNYYAEAETFGVRWFLYNPSSFQLFSASPNASTPTAMAAPIKAIIAGKPPRPGGCSIRAPISHPASVNRAMPMNAKLNFTLSITQSSSFIRHKLILKL